MQIPENMFMTLKENDEISTAARLEAEMTFMKKQLPDKKAADAVYLYPELLQSKEDMFLFAMIYGSYLTKLENGLAKVSNQVSNMFSSRLN